MKNLFKKSLVVMMVVILTFTASPLNGFVGLDLPSLFDFKAEAAATYSGTCGDNLTWLLDTDTGVLEISGEGAMDDYTDNPPWSSYQSYIKAVNIADGVTSIGYRAFVNCYCLTSITIPDNVTSIGMYAFIACGSLTCITVDENNKNYSNDEFGVLFNKDKTELIQYPIGNARTSYTIPDSVTTIGGSAFEQCTNLTSITIGNSVTTIGVSAFSFCTSLTSITIPGSVTTIESWAFSNCYSLTSIAIPDSVMTIGGAAFGDCKSLTSITLPDSVTTIRSSLFSGCESLTSITLPDGVTSIGTWAFRECTSLTSIEIPYGVTYIGNWVFHSCESLKYVHIPDTVTKIGEDIFYNTTAVYICSETEGCYARTYANENNIEFKVCVNIYNLGEETYGFENFWDSHSDGHCFGMAVTSSAYYLDLLDVSNIGIITCDKLNTLSNNAKVSEPICYYQDIQGSYKANAHISKTTWSNAINVVRNHSFDKSGSLIVDIFVWDDINNEWSGHSVNFLYYKKVDGQDRIYVYDNNFPTIETYFYQDSQGNIRQAPCSTYGEEYIDEIYLIDVATYFKEAKSFDSRRVIYSKSNSIAINGVEGTPMSGVGNDSVRYMFEIPKDKNQVIITPLEDEATFIYQNEEYDFENIDGAGLFILSSDNDGSSAKFTTFTFELEIKAPSVTTLNYGDTLVLSSNNSELPAGVSILWTVEGAGVSTWGSEDGLECRVTSIANGNATIYAKLVDADDNPVTNADGEEIFDEITLVSKAGFWQKFISFFKNLFGINRVIY